MTILSRLSSAARRIPPSPAKARAGRVVAAAATALGAEPICRTRFSDGSLLELDVRSRTEAGAFWNLDYEPGLVDVLVRLASIMGSAVHDVGANVGLVAVPLARRLREVTAAEVVCFEPVEANRLRLERNVALNGLGPVLRVVPSALGDREGVARIRREVNRRSATGNAVILGREPLPKAYTWEEEISVRRLDDLVDDGAVIAPNLVKLDVEGSEVAYLRGARRTLDRSRPVIVGEFNSSLMPNFGTTFLDAAASLPRDYAVFSFGAHGELVEVTPRVGLGDVVLAPRERVDDLRRILDVR